MRFRFIPQMKSEFAFLTTREVYNMQQDKKKQSTTGIQAMESTQDMVNYYPDNYRYEELRVSQLIADMPYKRKPFRAQIQEYIDRFNPLYLTEIVVSQRNGKYYVVDGGIRLAAMRKIYSGQDFMVACKIYSGLTYSDEAVMVLAIDAIGRGEIWSGIENYWLSHKLK